MKGVAVSILGAVFWFLLGATTTVAFGRNAILGIIDDITIQFCGALPLVCDLLGIGM